MSDRHPSRTRRNATDAASRRSQSLLRVWLSPSFPTGAYAYSHGLEKAVENGWIIDRATLTGWLADLVDIGSLSNDLILLACAARATHSENWHELRSVTALATALQPSAERELEATQQGASFLGQIEAAWPYAGEPWRRIADQPPTYPVAVGYCAARHAIPCIDTLDTYGTAFIASLASAAIRLSVIGQTDAQIVQAELLPAILAASARAEKATLDDLGSASWRSDIASLQHETQHTRLFRS